MNGFADTSLKGFERQKIVGQKLRETYETSKYKTVYTPHKEIKIGTTFFLIVEHNRHLQGEKNYASEKKALAEKM